MQFGGAKEAHEMLRSQPDAFVPHCPPEEDQRTAIEFSAFVGQLLHIGVLTDVDTAHIIEWFGPGLGLLFAHGSPFFPAFLKPETPGLKPMRNPPDPALKRQGLRRVSFCQKQARALKWLESDLSAEGTSRCASRRDISLVVYSVGPFAQVRNQSAMTDNYLNNKGRQ
jgi:hypothetical protein